MTNEITRYGQNGNVSEVVNYEPKNPQGCTSEWKEIWALWGGDQGETACWKLPELSQPCETITPCQGCLEHVAEIPK